MTHFNFNCRLTELSYLRSCKEADVKIEDYPRFRKGPPADTCVFDKKRLTRLDIEFTGSTQIDHESGLSTMKCYLAAHTCAAATIRATNRFKAF